MIRKQVADLPTRFKYVPVQPTDYSLTPAEVLMATDKELNEYMSVKKYAPYRLAKADKHRFGNAQQEKLRDLKGRVAERAGGVFGFDGTGQAEGDLKPKKRKGKKERKRLKSELVGAEEDVETVAQGGSEGLKKRKREKDDDFGADRAKDRGVGDNQENVPTKKRKRKHKEGDRSNALAA